MNQKELDSDKSQKSPGRVGWVDALRGVAIVLMIFIHVYRGWSSDTVTALPFYQSTEMFFGFAPTFFLGVVGMSMFLSMNRRDDAFYYVKRGSAVFVGGFSLNIVTFQSGRFNIFHIIGLSIILIAIIREL